ncbi:hypothetical protein BC629DRAFT_580928 [Irpex lacteus]|nr:hypothetical protein BC629DRAFT_580928 [Irpex lacteus]
MYFKEDFLQQASDANNKMRDVRATKEWEKLTADDMHLVVMYNMYVIMNKAQKRPITLLPWHVTEWWAEILKYSGIVTNMHFEHVPIEHHARLSACPSWIPPTPLRVSPECHIRRCLFFKWEKNDTYGNWRTDRHLEWSSSSPSGPSREDRRAHALRVAIQEARERAQRRKQRLYYKTISRARSHAC